MKNISKREQKPTYIHLIIETDRLHRIKSCVKSKLFTGMKGNEAVDAMTFQTEVKQVKNLLFRIAWSYMKNIQDVEDVVQDAIGIAWEKKDTLRDERLFRSWLARILCNQCKQVLRRKNRFSFFPLEEDTVVVEIPEQTASVSEAINKLKPEIRLLVTLYYIDKYTMKEISEMVGIPLGTVQTRLMRGRNQLKKLLAIEWEES